MRKTDSLVEQAHSALMLGAGADEYVPDHAEGRDPCVGPRRWRPEDLPAKRDRPALFEWPDGRPPRERGGEER